MSLENLLSRFEGVKSTGRDRWTCKCSAHDDKSPSMHIKLMDDGKVLINCKAGCDTYSILQAVGLDWDAIMPESPTHQRQKPQKRVIYATEALELIRFESQIIMACAYQLNKNKPLDDIDLQRAEKAMQTINKCLELTK